MILNIQIISFIVSFLYGIFFYFLLELSSRIVYSNYLIIKIVGSFLFILFNTLLYFIILIKINYGYVHLYFLICIAIGFFVCKELYKRFVNKK